MAIWVCAELSSKVAMICPFMTGKAKQIKQMLSRNTRMRQSLAGQGFGRKNATL
jgi:hypothetical protein